MEYLASCQTNLKKDLDELSVSQVSVCFGSSGLFDYRNMRADRPKMGALCIGCYHTAYTHYALGFYICLQQDSGFFVTFHVSCW